MKSSLAGVEPRLLFQIALYGAIRDAPLNGHLRSIGKRFSKRRFFVRFMISKSNPMVPISSADCKPPLRRIVRIACIVAGVIVPNRDLDACSLGQRPGLLELVDFLPIEVPVRNSEQRTRQPVG
jgi:hypothetical protein